VIREHLIDMRQLLSDIERAGGVGHMSFLFCTQVFRLLRLRQNRDTTHFARGQQT